MRHLSIVCLVFCACATGSSPQAIENHAPIGRVSTLKQNLEATVSVYFTFVNLDTGEKKYAQEIGVVIDATHVLTSSVKKDEIALYLGWRDGRVRTNHIGIMPYVPDPEPIMSGEAPTNAVPARLVAETPFVAMLETALPLSMAPITFAVSKSRVGESVYVLSVVNDLSIIDDSVDKHLRVWQGTVTESLHLVESLSYGHVNDIVLKFGEDNYVLPCGVFNQQHEFIGFLTRNVTEIPGGTGYWPDNGYYVISLRSLTPLMQQTGIDSFNQQP